MGEFRTATSLKISIEQGDCDGNFPVQSYTVNFNRVGANDEEQAVIAGDLHYYEIDNLEANLAYEVSVFASNELGDGPSSDVITVSPSLRSQASVPPAPVNLRYDEDSFTEDSM
jgi:hypothetical protein